MIVDAPAALTLREVRFGFTSRPDFLGPITMSVRGGEFWAVVGPNGAGKSTLLRLMAGLQKPHAGCLEVGGVAMDTMSGRERARRIAFVPQQAVADLDFFVRDIVLMGRFPHRSLGLFESADDYTIADRAMQLTETLCFADRPMATLSGGEAQRVHVAAALAQRTGILLLDEPTTSLDIQHQLAIFRILRDRAASDGRAVVVVTHDVNLALQFCSRVLLLNQGRVVASGDPGAVLTPKVLSPVYGVELTTLVMEGKSDRRWVVPTGAR